MRPPKFLSALLIALLSFTAAPALAEKPGKPILKKTRIEKELSAGRKYGYKLAKGHARAGKKAQRFELRHGDCGQNKYYSDCNNDRMRIERKEDPKNRMQKVGSQVWYGWSFYLDPSYPDLGKANTLIGQVKMKGWLAPLWQFNTREGKVHMWFDLDGGCTVGRVANLRGKWTDVVIFADYSQAPKGPSLVMYLNGKKVCTRSKPMVTARMLKESDRELYLKYGIYSSFVSRWLDRNKTKSVTAKPFKDQYKRIDGGSKTSTSVTSTPFDYDWGVEVPTQVVYYDEMRYGTSRAQVDIRMLEAAGVKPLD